MPVSDLKTLPLPGHDLAWLESGEGPPLLLIHGSLCDCRFWRPQMEPLSANRRVIAVSLRRYWPERWDGSGGGFSLDQHAQDLAALIEELGTGPADVVGHSRGGSVAWMLARRQPRLVRRLVLAEPGLKLERGDDVDVDRGGFRRRALDLLRQDQPDAALELFIDTVSGAGTWARMVPWIRRMMRDNANTLIGQAEERYETVSAADAAALAQPLLLIGGAQSPQPYPGLLDGLAALLPRARRATIPAASHAMNLWNAPAFNQAVTDFLESR